MRTERRRNGQSSSRLRVVAFFMPIRFVPYGHLTPLARRDAGHDALVVKGITIPIQIIPTIRKMCLASGRSCEKARLQTPFWLVKLIEENAPHPKHLHGVNLGGTPVDRTIASSQH